jgi:hypothetical protein
MVKAQHRTKLQRLVAPEDGTIQQLALDTIGGVAMPAQTSLAGVPVDSHLEIEAMVLNRASSICGRGSLCRLRQRLLGYLLGAAAREQGDQHWQRHQNHDRRQRHPADDHNCERLLHL